MKKVLYISNTAVPYRVKFFNQLANHCQLTVVYEREEASNRDKTWARSENQNFRTEYLNGIKIGIEKSFSFKIFKYIFGDFDEIIFGCYNSPTIMLAIIIMRLLRKDYILNVDGEVFLEDNFKGKIKKFFLKGAKKYLTAGEKSAESLKSVSGKSEIFPYYFSSLTVDELKQNSSKKIERNNTVLIVGQYLECKGLDVAVDAAKMNGDIKYKFIGAGKQTELFVQNTGAEEVENIEVIPFLQKEDLAKEYESCGMLVLPSRRECWGLVINEAASFGMPIVSTWGSGAAVEFLSDEYSCYLAKPGDVQGLYNCINQLLNEDTEVYSKYLIEKSRDYSIEKSVQVHLRACEIEI